MALVFKVCLTVFLMFVVVKLYQRTKEIQKKHTINLTVFSKVWLFLAVIFLACYLSLGFVMAGTEKIVADAVLLALIAALCGLSITFCRWYIDIDKESDIALYREKAGVARTVR